MLPFAGATWPPHPLPGDCDRRESSGRPKGVQRAKAGGRPPDPLQKGTLYRPSHSMPWPVESQRGENPFAA